MKRILLLCCLFLLFYSSANAVLIDRGTGKIYDTDQDITWLQDANLAASNTFGVSDIASDGTMNWYTAINWITNMNATNYLGYNDWRLPATVDGSWSYGYDGTNTYTGGYNITNSEQGYLYYSELGGVGYYDTNGNHQPNYGLNSMGPFINLGLEPRPIVDYEYWSGTDYSAGYERAWSFDFESGLQDYFYKGYSPSDSFHAWAVRDGDYGPSVTTTESYLTDFLTLGDTFTFDFWWDMGMEPTEFNLDILGFIGGKWEVLGADFNFGGSSTGWETYTAYVPEWARGHETQIRFVVADLGQETDPTVYLRNITSESAPIPEPATMLLFGIGLLGLAGVSRKKK